MCGPFTVIHGHMQSGEKFEVFDVHVLSGGHTETMLCLLVSALNCKKRPFHSQFRIIFFAFLCFLLVISLLKMDPKHIFEVLSPVLRAKRLDVSYKENVFFQA